MATPTVILRWVTQICLVSVKFDSQIGVSWLVGIKILQYSLNLWSKCGILTKILQKSPPPIDAMPGAFVYDFQSVEFSERAEILLFARENIALKLNG